MASKEKDISTLFDPYIECGEALSVNVNKRRAYGFYIGILVFFLALISGAIYEGQLKAIIFASLSTLFIAVVCIYIYLKKNPVLVIDRKGIILKKKFYSWENIETVKYEEASDIEGSDHIKFYVKAGKPVALKFEPFLFLDQKPKVMAAYIIKYFKVV